MGAEVEVDVTALIDAIRGPSPTYKAAEVDALVAQGDAVIPGLLAILQAAVDDPTGFGARATETMELIYAAAVLAHLRVSAAHDLLAELALLPEEWFHPAFGQFIDEGFTAVLVATCDRRTDRMREVLANRAGCGEVRAQAANALSVAVHRGYADRDEILDFLEEMLQPDAHPVHGYYWAGVADAMLRLCPEGRTAPILEALGAGLIPADYVDAKDVMDLVERGPVVAAFRLDQFSKACAPESVHDWLGGWRCFMETRTGVLRGLDGPEDAPPAPSAPGRAGKKKAAKRSRKRQKAARKKQRKKKR